MRSSKIIVVAMALSSLTIAATGSENKHADYDNDISGPAYSLNGARSTVYWEGTKPGGTHYGVIEVVSGTASAEGDVITGGSFEIDMNSIRN